MIAWSGFLTDEIILLTGHRAELLDAEKKFKKSENKVFKGTTFSKAGFTGGTWIQHSKN